MARIFRQSSWKQAIESNRTKTNDMLLSKFTPPVLTMIRYPSPSKIKSMATDRTTATSPQRRPMSAFEARVSLVLALASQASYQSQRLLFDLANETTKYLFPKRSGSRDLEEALMAGTHISFLFFFCLNFITFEVEQPGKWLGSSCSGVFSSRP
ncbi:hypothetical protein NC652_036744 [Populus alba x Populus x berolinensis]|nr:hypothetical protein NC652_036744 [Populus alba x Populus x berolinensis]